MSRNDVPDILELVEAPNDGWWSLSVNGQKLVSGTNHEGDGPTKSDISTAIDEGIKRGLIKATLISAHITKV